MMEVQEEKSDLLNDIHSTILNNNNNNNNNNEEKLVLTIKVNQNEDETETNESMTSVNQNFHPLNQNNNSTVVVHVTSDDSISPQPLSNSSNNISICNINGSANISNETETKASPENEDEEFDFSDSDFEEDEEVSKLPIPDDSTLLLSPGPTSEKSLVPSVDIEEPTEKRPNENDEDLITQFFDKANDIAEARLAARRAARAEAREIRMRELERQQKEQEQNADRVFDMQQQSAANNVDPIARSRLTAVSSLRSGASMNSRRSSEDSIEEEGRSLRDLRHELKDVEERFRKAMITNAQLDNERASQTYQIQHLKDKLEEMEESYAQLQREYREKSRDHDALKRMNDKLSEDLRLTQGQLNERDQLITEQGLTIVLVENEEGTDARRALVSVENAHLLGTVQGSLDVRLRRFAEEKTELQEDISKLRQQLTDLKSRGRRGSSMNGFLDDDEYEDAQREANKLLAEYKYKLQKAEQEIASLQASLARSETQVIRYKSTAEAAEKAEAELKIERRKLQRENREAMERLEEVETSNNHLLKRLDKLKNAKSALLKDL